MSKLKNYISIIIMLALIAVVGVLLLTGVLDVDETIAAVRDNKPAALLAILALFAVKGCSMVIPFAAVCIGTSLVFDLKMAMAINIVGTAPYRKVFKGADLRQGDSKVPEAQEIFRQCG